jgi:hypothetical protein
LTIQTASATSQLLPAILLLASLALGSIGLVSCGGGFAVPKSNSPGTTYTITVTGTSGSDLHTTSVKLIVQ